MFCKECGRQIDNDSEFCTYCGGSVKVGQRVNKNSARTKYHSRQFEDVYNSDRSRKLFQVSQQFVYQHLQLLYLR